MNCPAFLGPSSLSKAQRRLKISPVLVALSIIVVSGKYTVMKEEGAEMSF